MTKRTLLTTASAAVLAMVLASPAQADPNDFANVGDGGVGILNITVGGAGGDGGLGGNPSDAGTSGGNGGRGGVGGAGGDIRNTVNANSGNEYTRKVVNVEASNEQNAGGHGGGELLFIGPGNSIDTSGGYNKQRGGSASGDASTSNAGLNVNLTDSSGGDATGGSAAAGNADVNLAIGGTVETTDPEGSGDASGDASAHASANGAGQMAEATSGVTNGGAGGGGGDSEGGQGSTNVNETMSGDALANATGGSTFGPQNANGGTVSSGVMTIDGMDNAAGAFAMNGASGQFGVGNSANAVAAHVNTINTF